MSMNDCKKRRDGDFFSLYFLLRPFSAILSRAITNSNSSVSRLYVGYYKYVMYILS